MSRFSATTESVAVVPARRSDIWQALTDPTLLPQLTPLLRRIDSDGDTWTWHMAKISALGVSIAPTFTETMTFDDGRRIAYTHTPPPGVNERSGAEGWYNLRDVDRGTELEIGLTISIEIPLPRPAAPAVERIMRSTMERTGEKFSQNLMRHLGLAPDAALTA